MLRYFGFIGPQANRIHPTSFDADIATVEIDLGKNVIAVHGVDESYSAASDACEEMKRTANGWGSKAGDPLPQ